MTAGSLPLIVEPDALESALGADGLLIVDLNEEKVYQEGHIPEAVNLACSPFLLFLVKWRTA